MMSLKKYIALLLMILAAASLGTSQTQDENICTAELTNQHNGKVTITGTTNYLGEMNDNVEKLAIEGGSECGATVYQDVSYKGKELAFSEADENQQGKINLATKNFPKFLTSWNDVVSSVEATGGSHCSVKAFDQYGNFMHLKEAEHLGERAPFTGASLDIAGNCAARIKGVGPNEESREAIVTGSFESITDPLDRNDHAEVHLVEILPDQQGIGPRAGTGDETDSTSREESTSNEYRDPEDGENTYTYTGGTSTGDEETEQVECSTDSFSASIDSSDNKYPVEINGEYCSTDEPLKQINMVLEYRRGEDGDETYHRSISIKPRDTGAFIRCESDNCDSTSIEYDETVDEGAKQFTITITDGIPSTNREIVLNADLIALDREFWGGWAGPTPEEALEYACADSGTEVPEQVPDDTARFIDPSDYSCIFENSYVADLETAVQDSGTSGGGEGFREDTGLEDRVCQEESENGYQWGEIAILEHDETLELPEEPTCETAIRHTNLHGTPTIWYREDGERVYSIAAAEGPQTLKSEEIATEVEIMQITGAGTMMRVYCGEEGKERDVSVAGQCNTTGSGSNGDGTGNGGNNEQTDITWINHCREKVSGPLTETENVVSCLQDCYGSSPDSSAGQETDLSCGTVVESFCGSAGAPYTTEQGARCVVDG